MLHVLSVPKGMKFLTFGNTRSGTFKQGDSATITHYGLHENIAIEIPVPGFPRLGSQDLDCGWIANAANYNGQKDVEHLDLDGYLIPRSAFLSMAPKGPSDLYPSLTSKEFGRISYKWGGIGEIWLSAIVPYFGERFITKDVVGRWGTAPSAVPWRTVIGTKWLSQTLVASVHTAWELSSTLAFTVSWVCFKLSDDMTKYTQWTKTISHPVGHRSYTCEALYAADANVIYGDAITRIPATSAITSSGELLSNGGSIDLPGFKLTDRSDVFSGELNPVWGDLAADCYSQIQLWNSNALAYGKDLLGITTSMKELVASAKSLLLQKDLPGFAKNLADLFLSFRYGWSLTMSDTLSLIDADYARAYPEGRCKRSSAYTYFRNGNTITARMSVYCRPYSNCVSDLAGYLQMMDLELTAENIWDMIPLSFVVDWFVNVGGVLERFDLLGQLDRFSIFLTGQTLKVSNTVSADKIPNLHGTVGTLQGRFYKRNYTTDVILPSLISSRDSTQKFNHWIEGSALAIQRLR